ncbi:unnamed protein product [Amoebophrya sp. A120]|nr:unnamed protein product [Amoebophrya sp. A120]|eukprot:GSA120T00005748001.1
MTWQSVLAGAAMALPTLVQGNRNAEKNRMSIEMSRHSFQNTIALDRIGKDLDWFINGASLPTLPHHLLLTPGVQDRFGQLFAREAVDSRDFEVSVDFKIEGEMMRGQGFAMWYSAEDFATWFDSTKFYSEYKPENKENDFDALLKKNGLTFYGYQEKMNGFGVVFSEKDHMTQVHCVEDSMKGIRTQLGSAKFLRYDNKDITLAISRTPGNKVEAKVKIGEKWHNVCEVSTGGITNGSGYLGFTSYSGKGEPGEEKVEPATVGLLGIKATNHDEHHIGNTRSLGVDLKELEADSFNYANQTDQTQAIDRLERLLENFAEGHKDQKLLQSLGELGDRTTNLEATVKQFRNEVRVVLGHEKGTSIHDLKSHMRGLKTLLSHSSRDHENQVESARTKALSAMASMDNPSTAKSVEKFHESLEKIKTGSSSLMYMFGLIIFSITATTCAIWNKMRSYEKKHFL